MNEQVFHNKVVSITVFLQISLNMTIFKHKQLSILCNYNWLSVSVTAAVNVIHFYGPPTYTFTTSNQYLNWNMSFQHRDLIHF